VTDKHRIELASDATGSTARLLIDGLDISHIVTSLRLDVSAGHEHRLELQLRAFPFSAALEGVEARIDGETADVLQRLGWTPPWEKEDKR